MALRQTKTPRETSASSSRRGRDTCVPGTACVIAGHFFLWRFFLSCFLCFFLRIFLRRFFTTELIFSGLSLPFVAGFEHNRKNRTTMGGKRHDYFIENTVRKGERAITRRPSRRIRNRRSCRCLLYTSDAADDQPCV